MKSRDDGFRDAKKESWVKGGPSRRHSHGGQGATPVPTLLRASGGQLREGLTGLGSHKPHKPGLEAWLPHGHTLRKAPQLSDHGLLFCKTGRAVSLPLGN